MKTHSEYLKELDSALDCTVFSDKKGCIFTSADEGMEELVSILRAVKTGDHKLMFAGNGGSAAIAIHMTADFFKNAGFETINLFDGAVLTCLGNDYDFSEVFSRQVRSHAEEGDCLVLISSSGNSPDIVAAADAAGEKNIKVISFSGFKPDNKIRSKGDLNVYVPICHYGIVESIHNLMLQEAVDFLICG